MRKLMILILLMLFLGCSESVVLDKSKTKDHLVIYQGKIESIFFHPAIAFPEKAFDVRQHKNLRSFRTIDLFFNTTYEMYQILEFLYHNNYVLIDHDDVFERIEDQGKIHYRFKPIYFPAGKKPLLLSIDDLNYYSKFRNNGLVHQLRIDDNGELAAAIFQNDGTVNYFYDDEIILIFENFIKKHPDFSFNKARGIIALTGFEGVFGIPTQKIHDNNYPQYKESAIKVAQKLKEKGWKFASHSYSHFVARSVSFGRLVHDTLRWKKEVEPIIGETQYYIYPHGSFVPFRGEKINFLLKQGFTIFAGVDFESIYAFNRGPYLYLERIPIDGNYVRGKYRHSKFSQFFPIKDVIDPVRLKYDTKTIGKLKNSAKSGSKQI